MRRSYLLLSGHRVLLLRLFPCLHGGALGSPGSAESELLLRELEHREVRLREGLFIVNHHHSKKPTPQTVYMRWPWLMVYCQGETTSPEWHSKTPARWAA